MANIAVFGHIYNVILKDVYIVYIILVDIIVRHNQQNSSNYLKTLDNKDDLYYIYFS